MSGLMVPGHDRTGSPSVQFWSFWTILALPLFAYGATIFLFLIFVLFASPNFPGNSSYAIVFIVPVFGTVIFAVALISHVISYPALIFFAFSLFRLTGRVQLLPLLLLTPLLGLMAWGGYDLIVPDYRFFADETPPYQHGLTLERFQIAWGLEVAIVVGYWWILRRYHFSTRKIL